MIPRKREYSSARAVKKKEEEKVGGDIIDNKMLLAKLNAMKKLKEEQKKELMDEIDSLKKKIKNLQKYLR